MHEPFRLTHNATRAAPHTHMRPSPCCVLINKQVHELKERAVAEMGVLMAQAEKEQAGFEDEWRALARIIEDDKRERERTRAAELELRERETQELLRSGIAAQGMRGPRGTGAGWGGGRKCAGSHVSMG